MEFIYQYSPGDKKVHISLHRDSSLSSVIEAFEGFLRDAGYHFNGHIEIIEEPLHEKEKEENI